METSTPALLSTLAALAVGALAGLGLHRLRDAERRARDRERAVAAATPLPSSAPAAAAEALLADGAAILRRIRQSPSPFWRFDDQLRLRAVNDAYARLAGAASADAAVEAGCELFAGQRAQAADVRASRRFGIAETQLEVGGTQKAFDMVQLPIDNGEVLGFALDRSDREISRSLVRLRGLLAERALASVPVGVALFDQSRALLLHNPVFADFFKLSPELLAGRPDFDRLLDAMRAASRLPESPDFPSWREARRTWFAHVNRPAEEDWTLPTGEIVRIHAEATADGCLLLVFEDLTERVLLAGTRQSLLAVHQATLDHLTDGVAVFGPDGQIKLFNRRFAEIVLINPAELAATPTADALMGHVGRLLREPERARGLRDLIMSATGGRAGRSGRLSSVLGYVLDYRAVPLPDGNALFTLTDVTPRSPGAAQ